MSNKRRAKRRTPLDDGERCALWCDSHNYTSVLHTQVTIRDDGRGWEAEVDERLAPLILRLWAHDIVTISSCEDAAAWLAGAELGVSLVDKFVLCFLRSSDLDAFLGAVFSDPPPVSVRQPVVTDRGWMLALMDTTPEGIPGVVANAYVPWSDFDLVMSAL